MPTRVLGHAWLYDDNDKWNINHVNLNVGIEVAGRSSVAERARAEQQLNELCESGLPNPDLCNVAQAPQQDTSLFAETWSRGCEDDLLIGYRLGVLCTYRT